MLSVKIPVRFFFFLLSLSLFSSSLQALSVKEIDSVRNRITLDDGRKVCFAGIHLTLDASKTLAILFSKNSVEIEEEKNTAQLFLPAVYVWIHAFEMDFPFQPKDSVRESKILVNELLVSLGLASVDESLDFKKKDAFLKAQDTAKRAGKGMWSFEAIPRKKTS